MSNTAQLKFNDATRKWEASVNGRVFLKSASKDYVIDKIVNQISEKAKQLGVTAVAEEGDQRAAEGAEPALHFSIAERFKFLEDFVEMVATRVLPSAIITGQGGLGKTHTVLKTLARSGLQELDRMEIGAEMDTSLSRKAYVVVKGFSTAKGLYRTLYENRRSIIVFDDCDSILRDPVAANLLKAALDSYDRRVISWNAESFGSDDDLPRSFEFKGGVIFISNLEMYKIPQAIISRSLPADVSMTNSEIIDRMRQIISEGEFLESFSMEHKLEALEFIAENMHRKQVKSINLRTLINVTKTRATKPDHWQRLALYAMVAA